MEARSRGCLERRLQSSQEAQPWQAELVRHLQEKVLKYRVRCRELELQLAAGGGTLPGQWEASEDQRLKKALFQLEEEHQRCEYLAAVYAALQKHLQEATKDNAALREDVGKLRVDWMRAQEELGLKESEWRSERELYDSNLRAAQSGLLSLWHQVLTLRHHCQEMKTATDQDLSELKAEHEKLSASLLVKCSHVNSAVQLSDSLTLGSQMTEAVAPMQAEEDPEKELQDRLKDFAELEGKHSAVQSELEVVRKTLEGLHLQSALEKQEKDELAMVLEKLKRENNVLTHRVEELERTEICHQEKLSLCERRNKELGAEKGHLEQLLKKAEEQQEGLQVELRTLAEKAAETQEKLTQQEELASSGLEQLHQEFSRQGHALAKVSGEKEFLEQEKAALQLQLAAVERHRQGLSEELAEARSVKETLESSLLEAQQHLSQLKTTSSQLKTQLRAVTEAKEMIRGELKCLHTELEAERWQRRQEQENMTQQLLRTQQQCDDALTLRQQDWEMERSKLLQELASEREGHRVELQQMLERWKKEKAEMEREHQKKLLELKQEVATVETGQEEELCGVPNANQEGLLVQRQERLQRAVARLDLENTELRQFNAELRRTLEQVERERRRLRRCCRGLLLRDAGEFSASEQHQTPASRQEESSRRCSRGAGDCSADATGMIVLSEKQPGAVRPFAGAA